MFIIYFRLSFYLYYIKQRFDNIQIEALLLDTKFLLERVDYIHTNVVRNKGFRWA